MLLDQKSERKKKIKNTNTWRLNNILLNNQEITKEIKEEIRKYMETNDNKNILTQNLQDAEEAILRGKFLAIQSHLKKQEKSQINNLTLHLKESEKEEQTKLKLRSNQKIRKEINEIEIKKTIKQSLKLRVGS